MGAEGFWDDQDAAQGVVSEMKLLKEAGELLDEALEPRRTQ